MATETQESTLPLDWDLINDLGALPENEVIIVDYLLDRLQHDKIYTWVGSLLLTVNPRTKVSTSDINVEYINMLSELRRVAINSPELAKYIDISDVTREEAAPHIFAVAAKAHRRVIEEIGRNCQVIVISGEAGTGKTFNACKCLEFLNAVNKNPALLCQGDYVHNNVMLRITDACRLISAFTTACTERNETSSRHGQLVRLHYTNDSISGGTIESFLLERSRVTECCNNFQIFYQMMLGLPQEELHALGLFSTVNYDILNVIDCNKRKYYQDGFQDILREFDVLGFDNEQKNDIFQTLALMIHMGNIRFVENDETCAIDLTNAKCKEALRYSCLLSSLNDEDIEQLLTTILITPQSSRRKYTAYNRNLRTIDMCRNRLHSIIRHIYDLLFRWILDRVNSTLSVKHESSKWLGILDIFGFECFTENAIEQLCVNYANEKMQRYFMETYLVNSRKDLQEEGFIENENPLDTINLYKTRLHVIEEALFLTLNDACQSLILIDTRTIVQHACGNRHNRQRRFLSEKEGKFVIEHYSGPVAYSIKDLLSKNCDKVPTEISVIFDASNNEFLRCLLNINENNDLHTVNTSARKRTMLAKLKYSMDALIEELSKSDLHYVRCVKPNRLTDHEWDRIDFRKQLACAGIFDALPLAKCKYPIRLSYEDFCQRYSKKFSETRDRSKCEIILESIVPRRKLHTLVHYGKRLIFLTEPTFHQLEISRRNYRVKCANKIQTSWRKYKKNISFSPKSLATSRLTDKLFNETGAIKIINENESELSCNCDENDDVFSSSTISQPSNISAKYDSYIITAEDTEEIYPINNNNISKRKAVALKTLLHDSDYCQKICTTKNNGLKTILQSSMEGDMHIIPLGTHTLFYRDRILSRRRLAIVPIRVHTRHTCLVNSHVLPRSVMPRGLEDCL